MIASDNRLKMYQVDAFAANVFEGNPAAVLLMESSISDDLMVKIAIENNLSETAYLVPNANGGYALRWFTPGGEVDLCGHATLASAHVLATEYKKEGPYIFETRSGQLRVELLDKNQYLMDFPTDPPMPVEKNSHNLKEIVGQPISEIYEGKDDYLVILESEASVASCVPDLRLLKMAKKRGLIISAPGEEYDFVSRSFYPAYAIDEDPVTGSAHTLQTPYWTMKLKKNVLRARQISARGGDLLCIYKGDRTSLVGSAVTYMEAMITV